MVVKNKADSLGRYLREWRLDYEYRGGKITQDDIADEFGIRQSYVSKLERGTLDDTILTKWRPDRIAHLLRVYKLPPEKLAEAAERFGIELPSQGRKGDAAQIPSTVREIPHYHLTVPRYGKGQLVRHPDNYMPIANDLEGHIELYEVEADNHRTTYLVRRQDHAEVGKTVICQTAEHGTMVATVRSIKGDTYALETVYGDTILPDDVQIVGVVVYELRQFD